MSFPFTPRTRQAVATTARTAGQGRRGPKGSAMKNAASNPDPSFAFDRLEEQAARVAAEATDADTAREQLEAAQAALLERVIATVRPALRAIGTRPETSYRVEHHADVNYYGGIRTEHRAPFRALLVSDGNPGPAEDCPMANEGSYRGKDLFVREDGSLVQLAYSGTWSRWQGSAWGWSAKVTEYADAAEAIADGWHNVDDYVKNIADALDKAEGGRADAIARNTARAEQINAVVALLATKPKAKAKKGGRS